mgnify:CR=1 FL=1
MAARSSDVAQPSPTAVIALRAVDRAVVELRRGALKDIEVTEGHRIERPRTHRSAHGGAGYAKSPNSRLRAGLQTPLHFVTCNGASSRAGSFSDLKIRGRSVLVSLSGAEFGSTE